MGTVTGSTFNIPVYQHTGTKAAPLVSFSGNTFTNVNPIYTFGALVEDFYDNTFSYSGGTSIITIQGGTLTEDVVWQVTGTASKYVISDDFTVAAGTSLQITPGVQVSTNRYGVGDDDYIYSFDISGTVTAQGASFTGYTELRATSGGTLNLTGITLSGGGAEYESSRVIFQAGSMGTVTGSTFNIPVYQHTGTKAAPLVSFSGNTFTNATPIYTFSALVEDFYDNTFSYSAGISSITIQGGTLAEDVAWQANGTASRFVISDHFTVGAGISLQIAPGVQVSTLRYGTGDDDYIYDFNVSGTLSVQDASFVGYTDLKISSSGALNLTGTTLSGGGAKYENSRVTIANGAGGTVRYTKFNLPVTRTADSSISIQESDFSSGSFTAVGGTNLTVDMPKNWWGSTDPAVIENKITHKPDAPVDTRPLVTFEPFLTEPPENHLVYITGAWPSEPVNVATDHVDLTFNRPIDLATLTAEDVTLFGGRGEQYEIMDVSLVSGTTYRLQLAAPMVPGAFLLTVGPEVTDAAGNSMDQDRDGNRGEPYDDIFQHQATVDIGLPRIARHQPSGDNAGTVASVDITFTEPIDRTSLLPADVTLRDPSDASVNALAVTQLTDTRFRVYFPGQTAYGQYTIAVGPDVRDLAGNQLDQDGNGTPGEATDVYQGTFNLADVDLQVTDLGVGAAQLWAGDVVPLSWRVSNSTGVPLLGDWTDAVYLSADAVWDIDDRLLATIDHTGGLVHDGFYTPSLDVLMPAALPGNYHLIVRSDLKNQERENGRDSNNVVASAAMPLFVHPLADDGTPVAGNLAAADRFDLYAVDLTPGQNLRLDLDAAADGGVNVLYARFGDVPTPAQSDVRSVATATDATLVVPGQFQGGICYILVQANNLKTPHAYQLSGLSYDVIVDRLSPAYSGNKTPATVTLAGDGFNETTQVEFRDSTGRVQTPASSTFVSPTEIQVTLDLPAWDADVYDVHVVNRTGEPSEFADAFQVYEGVGPQLEMNLLVPPQMRYHLPAEVWLEYANTGDGPMPAPMFIVRSSAGHMSADPPPAWTWLSAEYLNNFTNETMVWAVGTGTTPGTLQPGDSGRVKLYYLGGRDAIPEQMEFTLGALTSAEPTVIDWASMQDDVRPEWLSTEAWEAMWANFVVQTGDTWGQLVQTRSDILNYLASLGQDTSSMTFDQVLAFAVAEAADVGPSSYLAGAVDAVTPAAGIPLVFSRVYDASFESRYDVGSLGRGWSHNWDFRVDVLADGDVILRGPGGADRHFAKNGSTYSALPGDYGALTLSGGKYKLTEQDKTVWQFRADGLLDYVQDTNGNRVTCTYDANGRLTRITHSAGGYLGFSYDANGRIETVSDPNGPNVPLVVEVEDYDAGGQNVSYYDTTAGNSGGGYRSDDVDIRSAATASNNNQVGWIAAGEWLGYTVTVPRSGEYDITLRMASGGTGGGVHLEFGPVGQIGGAGVTSTEAFTFGGTGSYDTFINVQLSSVELNAGTQWMRLVIDSSGGFDLDKVTFSGPGDDRVTTFTYDATGQYLLTASTNDGRTTTYAYDTTGEIATAHVLQSVTYPDQRAAVFQYDTQGRLVQTHGDDVSVPGDDNSQPVTYAYGPARGTVTVTNAAGVATLLRRGLTGQWSQVAEAATSSTLRMTYDDAGLPTQLRGPQGEIYHYSYDASGNVTGVVDPLHGSTEFTYDPQLNTLTSVTDARGNGIEYTYDTSGNLIRITYEDGNFETYTYDASGNVLTWTNRRGNATPADPDDGIVSYTYNAAGQVLSKDYSDTAEVDYTYQYDSVGRLVATTDSTGQTRYEYDLDTGWLTRINYPGGQWFTFEYDALGRRINRSDQLGHEENYSYDSLGRLDAMTDESDSLIVDYDYDVAGRIVKKTLGNDVYTTYGFDDTDRLITLSNRKPDDSVLSQFDYTYDASGRVTSMTSTYAPDDPRSSGTEVYGYDALGQLTSVEYPGSAEYPDGRVVEYVYDAVGNRIEVIEDGVSTPYTTNDMNQYTTVGDATYTFDADGNMTSKTVDDLITVFNYDPEGRLIRTEQGAAGQPPSDTWTYTYDATGNRVRSGKNGIAVTTVYDPPGFAAPSADYDSSGLPRTEYHQGYGLISSTSPAGEAYYTYDLAGNSRELTGQSTTILNSYEYAAFGTAIIASETYPNRFMYGGELATSMETSGVAYVGSRSYDPATGRFNTRDIHQTTTASNAYEFVGNAPSSNVGETDWWQVGLGTVKLVGGGAQILVGVGLIVSAVPAAPTLAGGFALFVTGSYCVTSGVASAASGIADIGAGFGAWPELDLPSGIFEALAQRAGGSDWRLVGQGLDTVFSLGIGLHAADAVGSLKWADRKWMGVLDLKWKYRNHIIKGSKDIALILNDLAKGADWLSAIEFFSLIVKAFDPNDKLTIGYGENGFVKQDVTLPYTIRFENKASATAPAQQVVITDTLDPDLDLDTFELIDFAFGDHLVHVPPGLSDYQTRVDLRPEGIDAVVDVSLTLDRDTREFRTEMIARDPETGWMPMDWNVGILPPNDSTGRGEGHISYFVKPLADLPTGTRIENEARIIFDFNEPIDTPVVVNTIDADRATSSVDPLPARVDTTEFDVSWSGQDGANGSGVGRYDIYVSINGGPYEVWLPNTTETTATYSGRNRHTYAFYSIATDNVGNRELKLPADEAVVEIGLTNHPPTDIALTPDSVPENSPGGTLIGLLTTDDPDPDETFTYTLLDDAGGRFEINGDILVVAAGADLDFETHTSHEITVRSADGDGDTVDETLTVFVTDLPDAPAGFLLSAISGDVTEAGGTATFTIAVTRPPTADVTIQFTSSDTTEGTVWPSSIVFTTAEDDWQTPRTITVTGVDDQIDDDNVVFSIVGTATTADPEYEGIHPAPVFVTNIDDGDTAGIEVSAISGDVTEDGQTVATFTVLLTSEPTGTVEIGISSSDPSEGTASLAALTFGAANWDEPQTVTVTGVDDWLDDGDVWFQIITAAAVSPDAKYSGRNAADLTLKNVDDDTAGFTLDKTQVTVGEDGTTDAFTVVLDAQPVTDVVLDISSSNAAEATVDRPRLTFTPADWNLPQTVTITAVDDAAVDGAVASTVTVSVVDASSDDAWDDVADQTVSVTTHDNDSAGFMLSKTAASVSEPNTTDTFTVVLTRQPASQVMFSIAADDATEATVDKATLTFTPADWDQPQTVTIAAVDDPAVDGAVASIVTVSVVDAGSDDAWDEVADQTVSVTTHDDDSAGFALSKTAASVSEPDSTDTFTVVLTRQPLSAVAFLVTAGDTTEATVDKATLTFTPADWDQPQTVTITAVDDTSVDGAVASTVTVSVVDASSDDAWDAVADQTVSVTTHDNDSAGFALSKTAASVSEPNTTDTFTVVLTRQPLSAVAFSVTAGDVTEATVDKATLTFTPDNWNQPQTVTITAVDDPAVDAAVGSVVTVSVVNADSDDAWDAVPDQTVSVTTHDDDSAGFSLSKTAASVSEPNTTDTFTVVLTRQPLSAVAFSVTVDDASEAAVDKATLTFTPDNWNQPQTVTITAVDDAVADGPQISTVAVSVAAGDSDDAWDALDSQGVSVTTYDNDTAGFVVDPTGGLFTSEAGSQAAFTIHLTSQPLADVIVGLSSSDGTEGTVWPAVLTFTASDWNVLQTVTVIGVDDDVRDGDQVYTIVAAPATSADASYHDLDVAGVWVTNIDDDLGWQNRLRPFDVDGDGDVTAADVLSIINYINAHGSDPSLPPSPASPPPYYDVNDDGLCTAGDVLAVINYINSQGPLHAGGSGEGEDDSADAGWSVGSYLVAFREPARPSSPDAALTPSASPERLADSQTPANLKRMAASAAERRIEALDAVWETWEPETADELWIEFGG